MTDQKETPAEYITKVAIKLLNYCTEDPDFKPQVHQTLNVISTNVLVLQPKIVAVLAVSRETPEPTGGGKIKQPSHRGYLDTANHQVLQRCLRCEFQQFHQIFQLLQ